MLAALAGCVFDRGGVASDAGGDPTAPDAATANGDGDGFPAGAISFFMTTACPSGWTGYADATGRTIVPSAGADVGVAVGEPLASNETRRHHHALAIGADLPSVTFVGIAGESNHGVARAGAVEGVTTTEDAAGALPTAQLLACRKTAPAGDASPPSGVIAFFADAACPASWAEAEALRGRLLIALPADGTHGATFGGEPLASGEARGHAHEVEASVSGGSHGVLLASGCCADGYAAAGDHAVTATMTPAAADVPYLQLLACVAP